MPPNGTLNTETGDVVTIAIARDPALVRTVRLVAAAVARRADCADAVVEEIRLAVGEACAVMIGPLDQRNNAAAADQVEVQIGTRRPVEVIVTGHLDRAASGFGDLDVDPLALLRGICEDLEVVEEGELTKLRMSWAA